MYPQLPGSFPTYYAMWLLGDAVCFALAVRWALREGISIARVAFALLIALTLLGFGAKMLYLAEALFFPNDEYVPQSARGPFHGFRIPGGVIALLISLPLLRRILAEPAPGTMTTRLLALCALFLVFIRVGCFFNGCCFGRLSTVPWALTFPVGSWAYYYHISRGWISPAASHSLAVHPLQLYFAGAAATTFLFVLFIRTSTAMRQDTPLLFFALFVGTSFTLEGFRGNGLHLNRIVLTTSAILATYTLLRRFWHSHS